MTVSHAHWPERGCQNRRLRDILAFPLYLRMQDPSGIIRAGEDLDRTTTSPTCRHLKAPSQQTQLEIYVDNTILLSNMYIKIFSFSKTELSHWGQHSLSMNAHILKTNKWKNQKTRETCYSCSKNSHNEHMDAIFKNSILIPLGIV